MKNKFLLTALIFISAVLPAYCAPITLRQTAFKFLVVMGGVVVSALIIYFGLTLYNKLFRDVDNDETLATPNSIQGAVKSFILRNRLK